MKRTGILLITFLIIMTFDSLPALSQSGPGGVGDMTNTQLWLRADRGVFTIMPFSAVVQWDDQSGNARNFKPVILDQNVPERTLGAVNGLPALTFDDMGGVNGAFLGHRGGLGFSGSDAATVIIVANNTSASDEQNGGLYTGQENVGAAGQVRNYSLEYSDAVRFNGQSQVFNNGHTAGNWKMVVYSNAAGSGVSGYRAWMDGTALTGNSVSATVPLLTSNFSLLGATQYGGTLNPAGFFDGVMAEVVVYSSQLNDASRLVIENSLGAKYNLTIANDHFAYQATHSHDVSGIAAYNGTAFTNGHSSELLSINSPSDLSEGEFLFYGHDNQSATAWTMTEVPAPGTRRIAREWRIDETSDIGTVTVSIPAASLPAIPAGYDNIAILTDADGDFTSGTVMHRATLTAGMYNLSLNLTDGQYITIIAFRPEISYTVISGSGLEGVTPVTVQATLNYLHTANMTADYAVTGGTATPVADFSLSPGVLSIPTGSLTGSFILNIVSDAILEPNETVIIGLLNPTAGVTVGSRNPYTYTIINDDFIYASLSAATAAETEGNATHGILAPQLVISGGILTIAGSMVLTVTNGTASASDWSQTGSLIAVPAGDYTVPVSIPLPPAALSIIGDLTVENNETVNIAINTFSVVTAGAVVSCVYTIVNDDNATIGVTTATPLIPEGGPGATGSGTYTFTLTNPSDAPRTVSYSITGTATSGTDFTALAGSFLMPANTLTFSVNLTTVADIIVEGDETVRVTVTGITGTPAITVDATTATITIDDDDLPSVLYTPASITMAEGGTATFEVWLANPPAGTVVLNLSTIKVGELTLGPVTLTFTGANYATHQVVIVQSVEDNVMGDNTDNIIITVNDALSDDPFDLLPDINIPVTIINNDIASLVVTPGSVTVAENGTVTFTVSLSAGPAAGDVVINLVSNDLTVATIDRALLTFTTVNWSVPQTVTVSGVNNNTVPNTATTISLTVNNALSDNSYDGLTVIVNVNVTNDDLVGFIVNPMNLTINEGGPAGQFTVVLTAQPLTNVVFDLFNAVPVHVTHPAQITFTPANWNVPVVVNVLAIEDALDADRPDLIAVTVNQGLTDNDFDAMAVQNVNINIEDNDPPVITGCPANINANAAPGSCSAAVNWTAPVSSSPMVSSHIPGSIFPVGVTTVTYTSTDDDGMVSTCTFTVTVTDTQPPMITCPPALTGVPADAGQCYATGVVPGVPVTSDNCGIATVTSNAPVQMPIGTTIVTWTVTDVNGLTATCTQTVQVVDTQLPTITCPLNLTVPSDIGVCGAAVTWSAPVFSDNCPGLTVVSSHNSGDLFPSGVTAVTYTVTDASGNIASCSFNITVTDPEPPALVTKDITVYPDASGTATIAPADVISTMTDNCPGVTAAVSQTVFTCANLGLNLVTVTATDASGNSVNSNASVIVADTLPPAVNCKPATVFLDAAGNGSVVPGDLLAVPVSDNCSIASVTLSRSSFTCADLGDVTVTVTVTDGSGNVSTCNSTVTVTDAFNSSVSAGTDAGICVTDPSFTIASATALNATVLWTTSGTGTFNNPALVNSVYTPGAGDAPAVTLTVTGTKLSGCPQPVTDAMTLTIAALPSADAGADTSLCSGVASVTLTDATVANGTILWTTSGSGTFSDPASVNPVYTFGSSDTGPVTLTLTVSNGYCTDDSDNLTVTFLPSPTADAGPDAGLCMSETGYQLAGASHSGGTVLWRTSGNGTFNDPTTDNPYYTFGTSDYPSGSVTLTMEITGTGLCSIAESSALITINPLPAITVAGLSNVTCPGLNDAEIHLSVPSGVAPVTYSIDGSPFQASGDFMGLAPGDWYFEVMDGNGCLSDTTVTVTEPLPFTAAVDNVTNVTCNGGTDGSADITAAGGTQPYSISWTGPAGFTATTEDISGLAAGVYDLTITDLYACVSFSLSVTVTEPPAITVTGVILSDRNGFGVTCPSGSDGFINVTVGGGTNPLAIAWLGPGGFSSATEDIADLEPGTYTLTVTDGAGCIFTDVYLLTAPEPMTVTLTTETGSCPDVADGSIDITVTGGTGTLTYLWDDGATLSDRPTILPGDHTVTITDANGCFVEQAVTVEMTGYNCLRVFEIITPNGDGRNDTWKMRNADLYPDAEVLVYNRWGKLVFNTRNAAGDEWDGTYKGKLLPNDSYHYVIYLNDGSEPRTGVISIISK